jgi:hypothetical protein
MDKLDILKNFRFYQRANSTLQREVEQSAMAAKLNAGEFYFHQGDACIMKANVGSIDKVIRIVIAVALFSLFFVLDSNWRYLSIVGFIPLITAIISWCPLYSLLGVNTCPARKATT